MGEATVSSCAAFLLRFSICGFHCRLLGLRTAGDSLPEVLPELSDTVRAVEDRELDPLRNGNTSALIGTRAIR